MPVNKILDTNNIQEWSPENMDIPPDLGESLKKMHMLLMNTTATRMKHEPFAQGDWFRRVKEGSFKVNEESMEAAFLPMFSMMEYVESKANPEGSVIGRDPHYDARQTVHCLAKVVDMNLSRIQIVLQDGAGEELINVDILSSPHGKRAWCLSEYPREPIIFFRCTHYKSLGATKDKRDPFRKTKPPLGVQTINCVSRGEMDIHERVFRSNASKISAELREKIETGVDKSLLDIPMSYTTFFTLLLPEEEKAPTFCQVCGKVGKLTCSKCKVTRYCGKECQLKDWKGGHRKECHPPEEDDTSAKSSSESNDTESIGKEQGMSNEGTMTMFCKVCKDVAKNTCSRCKIARYCSKECQLRDWREGHKGECNSPLEMPVADMGSSDSFVRVEQSLEELIIQRYCKVCGSIGRNTCGRCKEARYCSPECQAMDWEGGHKRVCCPKRKATTAEPMVTGTNKAEQEPEHSRWVDIALDVETPHMLGMFKFKFTTSFKDPWHRETSRILRNFETLKEGKGATLLLDGIKRNIMMIVKVQIIPGSTPEQRFDILIYNQGKRFEVDAVPENMSTGFEGYSRLHNLIKVNGTDSGLGKGGCKAYMDAYVTSEGKLRVMMTKINPLQTW